MSEKTDDDFRKANALIRAAFHIDPETLDDDQWALLANDALWLEEYRAKIVAAQVVNFLSPPKIE